MRLKCYKGEALNNDEYGYYAICFADNTKQARRIMWNCSNLSDACGGEYIQSRATREAKFDHLLDTEKKEAYIVNDNKTLRLSGFRVEGDDSCDTCGLYEIDGEFPICEECRNCAECGCTCKEK